MTSDPVLQTMPTNRREALIDGSEPRAQAESFIFKRSSKQHLYDINICNNYLKFFTLSLILCYIFTCFISILTIMIFVAISLINWSYSNHEYSKRIHILHYHNIN